MLMMTLKKLTTHWSQLKDIRWSIGDIDLPTEVALSEQVGWPILSSALDRYLESLGLTTINFSFKIDEESVSGFILDESIDHNGVDYFLCSSALLTLMEDTLNENCFDFEVLLDNLSSYPTLDENTQKIANEEIYHAPI